MPRRLASARWDYAATILLVGLATALRLALNPVLGHRNPFVIYFVAVVLAAWAFGTGPAILALGLGVLAAIGLFLPTESASTWPMLVDLVGLGLYISVGVVTILIAEVQRRAHARLEAEVAVRRRAEAVAAEWRDRYEAIIRATGHLAYDFDERTGQLVVGGDTQGILGVPSGALGGPLSGWRARIHHDDQARFDAEYQASRQEARPFLLEYRVRRPDDSWTTVLDRGHPILDSQGRVVRTVGLVKDISQERKAEERLRLAVEATGLGIWDSTPELDVIQWSGELKAIYGLPSTAQITAELFESLIDADDRGVVKAARAAALDPKGDGQLRVDHRIVRPDGETRWLEVSGRCLFEGSGQARTPVRLVGTALDITARKQSEARLRDAEEQLRERAKVLETVLSTTPTPIWISYDRECREITGNPASYRFLKMPEGAEVSATAPGDVSRARPFREYRDGRPIDPRDLPMQVAAREGREVHDAEITFVFDDGDVRHVYGNAVPLRDDDGQVTGAIAAYADITNLKIAQEALRDADRRKDEFLAMLAHELRNPLAPIQNAVAIMAMAEDDLETQRWSRELIDRQVRHLASLVDDLLDVSRITQGKIKLELTSLEVSTFIQSAVESSRPLIEARRHQLEISMPAQSLRVEGDPTRLAQIVLNLLNNAAKYTPEEGRIRLAVECAESRVTIRVRDNGEGIPQEMLPRVFDLFTQVDRSIDRSEGGLGIGLTLVKRLVEMHGGAVEAHSDGPGKGSEFLVHLPLSAAACFPGSEDPTITAMEPGHGSPRRIMVVDDRRDAAESLAKLLRRMGHVVATFGDGPSACRAVPGFQPDVVILDIGLPGMDGYKVAKVLRADPSLNGVSLIALSGYGADADRRRSAEAGFEHHLVKPVDPGVLRRILEEVHVGSL